MRHTSKKWLEIAAIALSASLVMSGCGGNAANNSTNETKATNQGQGGASAAEAPIEIIWANNFNTPEEDGNYVQTELEKKFNVKIKNIKLERGTWKEQFSVLLASGDIPDIFPVDANETDMVQWADQGIIATIDKAEIESLMPKYAAALDSVDSGAWGVGLYNEKTGGSRKFGQVVLMDLFRAIMKPG